MKKLVLLMIFCMVAQELTDIAAFDLVLDLAKCVFEVLFWLVKGIAALIMQAV